MQGMDPLRKQEEEGRLAVEHGGRPASKGQEEEELEEELPSSSSSSSTKMKPPSATSCLLPARSLRSTSTMRTNKPAVDHQAARHADGHEAFRSLSLSRLFSFRMPRAPPPPSLLHPTDAVAASSNSTATPQLLQLKQVCRSQSVPTSVKRFGAGKAAGSRRVAPDSSSSSPGASFRLTLVSSLVPGPQEQDAGAGDDVAAEEAVCRICMVALSDGDGDGTEVMKLECCCKGELALAHRGCAVRWFSVKGNGTCDVCGQEVLNLPVTLRRLGCNRSQQEEAAARAMAQQQHDSSTAGRVWVWNGTPILVIVSMLAYFCFLEQLLVGDHGTAALAISLPFACVLGLFSSLTTTKMVPGRYVWIYSAAQFLFIVLFTHLFYRYVRTQAVIAIVLSTFAGFGVAICANSVVLQVLRWRARRTAIVDQENDLEEGGHGTP